MRRWSTRGWFERTGNDVFTPSRQKEPMGSRKLRLAVSATLLTLAGCGDREGQGPAELPRQAARSEIMSALPSDLVAAIELRIADPQRRHDDFGGVPGEVLTEPEDVFALFEQNNPELGPTPFRDVVAQMNAWGQSMPQMHVTRYENGGLKLPAPTNWPCRWRTPPRRRMSPVSRK